MHSASERGMLMACSYGRLQQRGFLLVVYAMEAEPVRTTNPAADTRTQALARVERALAIGRAAHATHEQQQRARRDTLKQARATLSDAAWELEEVEQRLRDLADEPAGPRDPLLERELAALKQRRAAAEEYALQQMFAVEQLAAEVQAAERKHTAAAETWTAREKVLERARARLSAELAHTGAKELSHREHRGH